MRATFGLSFLLIGLSAIPAGASDEKLDTIGRIIDVKKADESTIRVVNRTGFCLDVSVVGIDVNGSYIEETQVEPEGVAVFNVELVETVYFVVSANTCESGLCTLGSENVDVAAGGTTEVIVTQSTSGGEGEEGEGDCQLDVRESSGSSETASLAREAVVLTCSSTGLLALVCLGYFLGRPPRRRPDELLQQE